MPCNAMRYDAILCGVRYSQYFVFKIVRKRASKMNEKERE